MRLWKKGTRQRLALLGGVAAFLLVALLRHSPSREVAATSPRDNLLFLSKFYNCQRMQLPRLTHQFHSKVCSERRPWLLYVVHSAVGNWQRRLVVRSTWGSVTSHRGRPMALLFVVGLGANKSESWALEEEQAQHGDLVQGDFQDSYRNMSYKHLLALHLASSCSPASLHYVVKVDDDTMVNPFRLVEHLELSPLPPHSVLCRLLYGYPERNPAYKHFLTKEEFPLETYPRYCCGFAYVIRPRDAAALVQVGNGSKFFWVDDVYVTGMLRLAANITIENFRSGWEWGELFLYDRTRRGPKTDSAATRSHLFHLGENVPEQKYTLLWSAILHSQIAPTTA